MPLGATPRVLPPAKPEPHLSLVDNVGAADSIIDKAQEQQVVRLEIIEGLQAAPTPEAVRRTRRRRTAPQKPVVAPVEVTRVNQVAKGIAMLIARGDWTRCQLVNANEIVVHNHPIRQRRSRNAGRTRSAR